MDDISGLNNRVFQLLSQKSSKAAVDLLGMRLSTNFNGKFTGWYLMKNGDQNISK